IRELRIHARSGEPDATVALAELLAKKGRVSEALNVTRTLPANTSVINEPSSLIDSLVKRRRAAELQELAEKGFRYACKAHIDLLLDLNRVDEALAFLRQRATGLFLDGYSEQLAKLLREHGREDELQARAQTRDYYSIREFHQSLS